MPMLMLLVPVVISWQCASRATALPTTAMRPVRLSCVHHSRLTQTFVDFEFKCRMTKRVWKACSPSRLCVSWCGWQRFIIIVIGVTIGHNENGVSSVGSAVVGHHVPNDGAN